MLYFGGGRRKKPDTTNEDEFPRRVKQKILDDEIIELLDTSPLTDIDGLIVLDTSDEDESRRRVKQKILDDGTIELLDTSPLTDIDGLEAEIQQNNARISQLKIERDRIQQQKSNLKIIQSRPIQPGPIQPRPIQSRPIQPGPIQPRPIQSRPIQPGPIQPRPIQPGPIQSSRQGPVDAFFGESTKSINETNFLMRKQSDDANMYVYNNFKRKRSNPTMSTSPFDTPSKNPKKSEK
jgi:hypothetical protein